MAINKKNSIQLKLSSKKDYYFIIEFNDRKQVDDKIVWG